MLTSCLSQDSQTTPVVTVPYLPTAHSDPDYRTGACSFTRDLPIPTGARQDYYYNVLVYPGPTAVTQGPVTIRELLVNGTISYSYSFHFDPVTHQDWFIDTA